MGDKEEEQEEEQEQVKEGKEGKPALTIKNKDKDDKDDEIMIDDFKENTKTTEKPENINTGTGTAISKVLYDLLQSYNPKLVQSALANIMTTLEEEEAKEEAKDNTKVSITITVIITAKERKR